MWPTKSRAVVGWKWRWRWRARHRFWANIHPLLIADPLVCSGYQQGSKGRDDKWKRWGHRGWGQASCSRQAEFTTRYGTVDRVHPLMPLTCCATVTPNIKPFQLNDQHLIAPANGRREVKVFSFLFFYCRHSDTHIVFASHHNIRGVSIVQHSAARRVAPLPLQLQVSLVVVSRAASNASGFGR